MSSKRRCSGAALAAVLLSPLFFTAGLGVDINWTSGGSETLVLKTFTSPLRYSSAPKSFRRSGQMSVERRPTRLFPIRPSLAHGPLWKEQSGLEEPLRCSALSQEKQRESSESRARDSVTEETLPQTLQSSSQRSVMGRWSTRLALLMLLIGQISAETSSSSNACQDQNALHDRMDAVEKVTSLNQLSIISGWRTLFRSWRLSWLFCWTLLRPLSGAPCWTNPSSTYWTSRRQQTHENIMIIRGLNMIQTFLHTTITGQS
ncbi:uncharacterized protein LOC107653193 isoform X2 [Sinocyclocheilus anshuiensis]|uniref:uncharacterized protein LOC107653193 isoform X2 n=1 Tax=Sinocyclocheilus anshuiensis TaxID=1608454 RepID=UPI0007B9142E|nr:PREDICTED: uncharacterized protein LOC107653193 isoform X2 [Sinocyclocheilus anshuiensis]